MLAIALLIIAGLTAGAVNAIAGGGTLVSFPVLVWLGLPPIMANATATFTALPGYMSSAWAFRRDIHAEGTLGMRSIAVVAAFGGLLGAGLLLVTPKEAFSGIVPWLLMSATMLFALVPNLQRFLLGQKLGQTSPVLSATAVGAVAIYGGYFNGGLGIMLLAVFGLIGFQNLNAMNGLKNLLSAILSLVSVLTYASANLIAWEQALLLATATTAGGFLGGHYARKLRPHFVRYGIIVVGGLVTTIFFLS